jgi:phosphopantothenoylcysteine decarboxylase
MKRKIILGLTGSVATVLYKKLIAGLQSLGDVIVVPTDKADHFVDGGLNGVEVFRDFHEWTWVNESGEQVHVWKKDYPVLHIRLREMGSALVIAPCSVNTMGKLANGICDNLLTSIARAWDFTRPIIVAPAGNTYMWEHPVTEKHIAQLLEWDYTIIPPQSKMLACGTQGMGALADIDWIVESVKDSLQWSLPIAPEEFSGFPDSGHPGAFATQRKHEKHTGVDLYCADGTRVIAVESGRLVGIEHFTGEWDNTPWWNNTDCILIEGATGVVCYGEIEVSPFVQVGSKIEKGQFIGNVKRVLKEGKERTDIPGHSTSMLHMELYPHGTVKASNGFDPHVLHDVMPFLLEAENAHKVKRLIYVETY